MTMNCRVNSLLSSKRCGEELAYKLLCFNVSIQSSTFNAQNCNTTKSSLPDKLAQNITKKNGCKTKALAFPSSVFYATSQNAHKHRWMET